nr:uncharacterized protein LOC109737491 isoform X2 [Aegilops tauschii subsp. strangulata]
MQPPSPRSRSTGPPPTLPAIPNPTTETAAPAPAFFLAPDAAARLLSGECRGATAVEAAVGWSPASSPLRSPWRSAASNLLDGARNPRRPISSSHGHGHGEPTSCAAADIDFPAHLTARSPRPRADLRVQRLRTLQHRSGTSAALVRASCANQSTPQVLCSCARCVSPAQRCFLRRPA